MLDDHTGRYSILASSVALYYDFALTLPQEIKHIWFSKFSFMNVLLIALRYVTAIDYASTLWLAFWPVPKEDLATFTLCENLLKLPGISVILCQGFTSAFLIIRLFAIYDKKKWILYATIPFGLLNIVLQIFGIADVIGVQNFGSNVPSTCFGVPYSGESSFVSILLRDGSILYAILSISNAFNFIILMLGTRGDNLSDKMSSGITTYNEMTPALSAILASRMIFNLREAGTEIYEGTEEWRSRIERTTRDMRFHVPTTVREGSVEVQENLESWNGDVEVDSTTPEDVSA